MKDWMNYYAEYGQEKNRCRLLKQKELLGIENLNSA